MSEALNRMFGLQLTDREPILLGNPDCTLLHLLNLLCSLYQLVRHSPQFRFGLPILSVSDQKQIDLSSLHVGLESLIVGTG